MIRIYIREDQSTGRFSVIASGHAGTAPAGQDIVCAGVSILLDTLAEAMCRGQDDGSMTVHTIQRESGMYRLEGQCRRGTDGVDGPTVLQTVAAGLALMQAAHPEAVALDVRVTSEGFYPDGKIIDTGSPT